MITSTPSAPARPDLDALQVKFLSLLPRIERHGRICFRYVRRPHMKEDLLAEMAALAWKWYVRLARRGKDVARSPSALASYAARAVRSGRLCGQENGKDVPSPLAQRRHGFDAGPLPAARNGNVFDEALRDNTLTPIPDQVSFRCDFPDWVRTYADRDRRVIGDLMSGERTLDVAERHRLSPGRISQVRRDFHREWESFCAAAGGRGASPKGA